MNAAAVQSPQTLDYFLKLAHSARVRNAGFKVPLSPNNTVSNKPSTIRESKITAEAKMLSKLYASPTQQKDKQVSLGTRFDAYA